MRRRALDRVGEAAARLHLKTGLQLDVADLDAWRLSTSGARVRRIARPVLPQLIASRAFIVKAGLIGGFPGLGRAADCASRQMLSMLAVGSESAAKAKCGRIARALAYAR